MNNTNQNNDNEMLRILEPMMHCICDKLCIMPRKGYDQEKLEEVCNDCKVGQYSIDILNAYERAQSQAKKVTNIRGDKLKFGTCPSCGKRITNVEGGNYCQNCGQRLEWEE